MFFRVKSFLIDIYQKRQVMYELAKRDFQQQYMGSYLGFVWVFLQPLLFISVLYMVFTFGFRTGKPSEGVPFVVYLVAGMIAWFFFSDNLIAGANIVRQHSFLLKKIDFRLSILPIVKLMSLTIPHLFFIVIALIIAAINGIYPSLFILQLFYYFFAMVILLLGSGWLTSSTNVFIKDVSKMISIFVQFGFWLTPIFWNVASVPEKYHWIIKLNPAYYVVEGYRDSIIYKIPFWEKPYETLYFWTFTIGMLWIGITVFKKLRPHFAEVI